MSAIPIPFQLSIELLRSKKNSGEELQFEESVAPDFLQVEDGAVQFLDPVLFKGRAYLAGDQLMIHWGIQTQSRVPCPICNEWVTTSIHLPLVLTTLPLCEIPNGILDLRDLLREEILLHTPTCEECCPEGCPERSLMEKYLRKN